MQVTRMKRNGGPMTTYGPFENLFGRFDEMMRPTTYQHLPEAFRRNDLPELDTYESEDAFYLDVDLPGLDREDLKVELVGKELRVSGERKWEKTRKKIREGETVRTEMGRFDFTVTLPPNMTFDEQKIVAKLEKGVLQIEVPKIERTPAKEIQVK